VTSPPRNALSIWMQVTRIQSLIISTISVFSGGAVAFHAGRARLAPFLLAWLGAVAVQAGTNLTNIYYNYKARVEGYQIDPRGSSAVVQFGWLEPADVRRGSLVCFAVAVGAGLLLTWMCGWPILLMGIPGAAAGFFYAAPPLKLAYKALGVLTVFVFIGPVMVAGTSFAMTLGVPAAAWPVSIAVGLMAAGIMHINDLRDLDDDLRHGKRTLSTMIGRRGARRLLAAMDVVAYAAIVWGAIAGLLPWPAVAVLASVPMAVTELGLAFRETDAAPLNVAWFRGVQLHLQFGVLLIAGLLAASAFGL